MSRIHAYLQANGADHAVGVLHLNLRRGRLTSTFTYDSAYVGWAHAYAVEPALPLSNGNWSTGRSLPRSFDDAAPDRWGRNLIAKRLRAEASTAGGPLPQIDDGDYLMGVSDETRQGALRFTTIAGGEFLHPSQDVPKLVALPALLRAADHVSRHDVDDMTAIKTLLDAGSGSLGGARPKASVRDGDQLLIAKFPHHSDHWDVMAWEKIALDLAAAAGIVVPERQLVDLDGNSVLLLDRFDRTGSSRIGYISAMTLIEGDDGQARDYLEIAEALPEHSASASADLQELFRRIAFSIAVHNTDDHLRNHGFLRHLSGWSLAPAFDINPNPDLTAMRVTGIGGAVGPVVESQTLIASAPRFGLSGNAARKVVSEVVDAVRQWRSVARRNEAPEAELNLFAGVFEHGIETLTAAAARP